MTGHLVPSEDAQAMANALWRCYSEPETSARYGQTARARALVHFGLAGMIDRYRSLFSTPVNTKQIGL